MEDLRAICLMGPTASGKTDLAVELVRRLPVEIVSVDSAMVYRGMDVGTAKPGADVLAEAPHRLIDICDPADPYSAARFREDALAAMEAIRAAGRVPLLVGGTMLYFHALTRGLARLPEADAALRDELAGRARRAGWPALHAELARFDAEAAARIHPNDLQRIQRAIEVYRLTGRPLSALQREARRAGSGWRFLRRVLAPPARSELHRRIARRFDAMLAQGLVEEVEALHARGDLSPRLPSIRSVGYRQCWDYLEGRLDREGLRERGIVATRQLAKRQVTWLRKEAGAEWWDASEPIVDRAVSEVERFVAAG